MLVKRSRCRAVSSKNSFIFKIFFQIAAEVAAPLSRVDEIVMLGGDNSTTTSEVTKLLAEMPPAVQAITGVDISQVSMELRKMQKN